MRVLKENCDFSVIVMGDHMRAIFLFATVLSVIISASAFAGTKIKVTENPLFPNIRLGEGEIPNLSGQYQDKLDKNGPNAASAFLFSNMLGYSNGTVHISRFEAGFNAGAVLGNMGYFNDTARTDTYPLGSPVINMHAGMPLSKKSDLTLKLSIFDMVVTGQKPEVMDYQMDSFGQLLIGGKYRRTYFERKQLVPFLLEFEGLTLGASADIMNGSAVINNDYSLEIDQVGVDPGTGAAVVVDTEMKGTLTAQTRWLQFSTAYDCLAYFTTMRFISVYGGFGMILGYSWIGIDATTKGNLYATDDSLDASIGDGFNYQRDYLLELDYESLSVFTPFPLLPYFSLGTEFDIHGFKVLFETSVNLANRRDVAALFGMRYQL